VDGDRKRIVATMNYAECFLQRTGKERCVACEMLWMKYEEESYPCTVADLNFATRFEEDKAAWLEACPCFSPRYTGEGEEQGTSLCAFASTLGPSRGLTSALLLIALWMLFP
jgi:hypothetical protein